MIQSILAKYRHYWERVGCLILLLPWSLERERVSGITVHISVIDSTYHFVITQVHTLVNRSHNT